MAPKPKYTFEEFCEEFNHIELLKLWDYEKNNKKPSDVGYKSSQNYFFKCPNNIHESREIPILNIVKAYESGKQYVICHECNSLGQHIINCYGSEYLNSIWSEKNKFSPFNVEKRSKKRIWVKCLDNDSHPDYDLQAFNFVNSHNCPYCVGKRVCESNSLAFKYPNVLEIWSNKNVLSPYDYTVNSHQDAWFKCENNKHNDYKRQIDRSVSYGFRCPICGKENQKILRGENHPLWKGIEIPEWKRLRTSSEYKKWRNSVYQKDWYTCQCCGQYGGKLNAHHILDYMSHEDLQLEISNGITLCVSCHDTRYDGSFHNIYGTHHKTPEQLEEYINNKRKQLGINIPFSIDEYLKGNILKPNDINKNKFPGISLTPSEVEEYENYEEVS